MKIDKMKMKRFLTLFLAFALALTVFVGCEKDSTPRKNENEQGGEEQEPPTTVGYAIKEGKYGTSYPLEDKGVTLTYWKPITAAVQKTAQNYGDLPFSQALEKKTGVKIEYKHPSLTNAQEQFTLMLSSGKLPDMIAWNFNNYTGGAQAAIDGGIIHALNVEGNSILDAWAPDYLKLLESYPDSVGREAKTDKGLYYSFGVVSADRELNTTAGPIVRGDWLEDLGLDIPKTIDDWYKMLKAFKEKKGATAPLSLSQSGFYTGFVSGAYGINLDFYRDGDTVKFGPVEPGYKEYLTTMNKWYKEGLFDKDFDTTVTITITQNLLTGKSGATWNALGGGIGTLMTNVEAKLAGDPNKNAKFIGVPYPTLDGSKSEFGQASSRFTPEVVITTQCKDVELAAKWLNYGYTDAGHMLYNFGLTEADAKEIGINTWSYDMVDGYPKFTKEVTNNPMLTMQEAFTKYSQAGGSCGVGRIYRQDPRYLEQYAVRPEQKDAWKKWCDTNAFDHYVPNTGVAEDVAKEYSQLYVNITAYVQQEYIKFVKGGRPLSDYDNYVQTLKDMGVDKMIKIKQDAYNAYLAR